MFASWPRSTRCPKGSMIDIISKFQCRTHLDVKEKQPNKTIRVSYPCSHDGHLLKQIQDDSVSSQVAEAATDVQTDCIQFIILDSTVYQSLGPLAPSYSPAGVMNDGTGSAVENRSEIFSS